MRYMGTVFRVFKPKVPDYEDKDVRQFVYQRGEDIKDYSGYVVVPKQLGLATVSLKKYDRENEITDPEVHGYYDVAEEWLEREFGPHIRDSEIRSFEYVHERLEEDKVPGYPWALRHGTKGDYWASDDGCFENTYWDALATECPIHSLFSSFIKEELRPREKVESGNVRTIIAADVNHVACSGRLFMHQNERLHNTNLKHSSAVGMKPFGGGWDKLNAKMSKFGKAVIESDGNKYDARYMWHKMLRVYRFRYRMLRVEHRTPENCMRVFNICFMLVFGPVVNVDGRVFSRWIGNPSGQGNTTEDNTLGNYLDWSVIWQILTPVKLHCFEAFKACIILCLCGDDNNTAVAPATQQFMSPQRILDCAFRIGMVYTMASLDFRFNYECTFLGHGFQRHSVPGFEVSMYFPVIDCSKMRSSMLVYNEHQTAANTIIRANGLRLETFMCVECREWFSSLICFLEEKYYLSPDVDVQNALKSYKTDAELWVLYSGLSRS